MITEQTTIENSDGDLLEAAIDTKGAAPAALAIICHAHPKMGGTMNAPLLLAVRDELVARSWACLRFNFRGVGTSQGAPGLGVDEVDDARSALALGRTRYPDRPAVLIGWSFGAAVAVRTASVEPGVGACAAVAPAIRERPGLTAGLPPASELRLATPVLVVCGSNDDQTPPEHARAWAADAGAEFVEIPGANHFFWAKYQDLATLVADWIDRALDRSPA